MRDIINKLKQLEESHTEPSGPQVGDEFGLSFSEDLEISTTITDVLEDGIVVEMDDTALAHIQENGAFLYDGEIVEEELDEGEQHGNSKIYDKCRKGWRKKPGATRGSKGSCIPEGIEEAGLAGDPENRDGLKPWLRLSQLMDQEITKISLKSDEGIELSNSLEAVTNMIQSNDKLLDALTKTGEPKEGSKVVRQLVDLVKGQLNKGESIPVKADSEDMIKFINDTIVKFNAGAEFDRTKIKDPNPEPEMEKENSELDRIKSLSGLQTEDDSKEIHGEVDYMATGDDGETTDCTLSYTAKIVNGKAVVDPKSFQLSCPMDSNSKLGYDDDMDLDMQDPDDIMDAAQEDADEQLQKGNGGKSDVMFQIQDEDGNKYDVVKYMGKIVAFDSNPEELSGGGDGPYEYLPKTGLMYGADGKPKKTTKIGQESFTSEAEYQGRKVSLGKPTRGDVKKFKVYVKNPKGNVVKVNFGDPNMKIKKSNPARRRSFRARHNCSNPGPRHKARYWSCRKW